MGDLSEHFSRREFACKCKCGLDIVDYELIIILEDLSDHFDNKAVTVNSGCRCPEYNRLVGGRLRSQHRKCRAADITIKGIAPSHVYLYLSRTYPYKYGIGSYINFTHIDTRSGIARWNG